MTQYDAVGNVLSITDPVGNQTSYQYDGLNRLRVETNELGRSRTYQYDVLGNRTQMTDRNGQTRTFTYDGLNRLTSEQWLTSSGSIFRTIASTYDTASQLTGMSDPDSAYTYTYDLMGRVQTVSNAGTPNAPTVVLSYTYDANGNVQTVSETLNGTLSSVTTYAYDSLNRVAWLTQSGAGGQTKRVEYAYNEVGQTATVQRFMDLAGMQLVAITTYTYDTLNRLAQLQHQGGNGSAIAGYDFGYDAASRITRITDIDGTTNYGYDDTNQLTGADSSYRTDESYSYDANGNRTNAGYQTGVNNQLLSDGVYTYTYDDEGNLKTRTKIGTSEVRTFTWDYRNRLVGVTDQFGTMATRTVSYTYDVLDRRIAKSVNGNSTQFVYDGDNVILEFNGSAIPSVRYLQGPGVDQTLAQEGNGQTSWMLTDHLGTVRDLVNNSGTVVNHFTYDSFGQVLNSTEGGVDTRYKYTGREFDVETGLYYYRARYFDASVGKFIGQDPIGFSAGDSNLYRYVANSPLMATDPSGHASVQLTALLTISRPRNGSRNTYEYPKSLNYFQAFVRATNWFYLITERSTRFESSKPSPKVDWVAAGDLKGGRGKAVLRPKGNSGLEPTIDLQKDGKGRSHNSSESLKYVTEVKFPYDNNPDSYIKLPCPELRPFREPELINGLPGYPASKTAPSPTQNKKPSSFPGWFDIWKRIPIGPLL